MKFVVVVFGLVVLLSGDFESDGGVVDDFGGSIVV